MNQRPSGYEGVKATFLRLTDIDKNYSMTEFVRFVNIGKHGSKYIQVAKMLPKNIMQQKFERCKSGNSKLFHFIF